MPWLDARLPLRFGSLDSRAADEAVLTDGAPAGAPAASFAAGAGHVPGCACCSPRSAAATALAALFRERATAVGIPFRAVLAAVNPANEAAVRDALANDPLAAARYRLSS